MEISTSVDVMACSKLERESRKMQNKHESRDLVTKKLMSEMILAGG